VVVLLAAAAGWYFWGVKLRAGHEQPQQVSLPRMPERSQTQEEITLETPSTRAVQITGNNAAQLKLKVLARIQGNAYQIDSTADSHTVSVLPVGVDRGVILIDIGTGIEAARCKANYSSYAISGSGRIVAGAVGGEVQLCDPLSPTVVRSLQPVAGDVTSLAFSANGRFLASGSSDSIVRVWDVTKGELVWTSSVDNTPVAKVSLSPDGSKLAAAYRNLSVKYWDLEANTSRQAPLPPATSNTGYVRALSLLTAGRRLLIGLKGVTWLWDVTSEGGAAVRQLAHSADAVSPDERIVVSVGEYVGLGAQGYTPLALWDLSSGAEIATVNTPRGMLAVSATFTKDGSALLASTNSGEILVWRQAPK
jgi:WD40 repeat protein